MDGFANKEKAVANVFTPEQHNALSQPLVHSNKITATNVTADNTSVDTTRASRVCDLIKNNADLLKNSTKYKSMRHVYTFLSYNMHIITITITITFYISSTITIVDNTLHHGHLRSALQYTTSAPKSTFP